MDSEICFVFNELLFNDFPDKAVNNNFETFGREIQVGLNNGSFVNRVLVDNIKGENLC